MRTEVLLAGTILLCGVAAAGRTWTPADGLSFEAEVVWVNENRDVKLALTNGTEQVFPFAAFGEDGQRILDELLFREIHGDPHPVSPVQMNGLFGLPVWNDIYLWDDLTERVAGRMQLNKESETGFMANYRAYPLGEETILSEPVYTTVLYGTQSVADSLCFVFLNQGDIPLPKVINKAFIEKTEEAIEEAGMRVHDRIASVLGDPQRDTIGKGSMREKVWRWDWNGHALLLSMQEGKYAMLRILPTERADRSGKTDKIDGDALRQRMLACVERRDNGDVVIRNIPMIDQGPKGYCSPATWERCLRYLGIPANMYQLANAGNTGIGGGTYTEEMIDATRSLLFTNGRDLDEIDDPLTIDTVAEYIDEGMPVMWSFATSSDLQREINLHTARRNGKTAESDPETVRNVHGGHICLITGYNRRTDEIAISDSWGPDYAERWLPVHLTDYIPHSLLYIIK